MQPQNQMDQFSQSNQAPTQDNMSAQEKVLKQKNKYVPVIVILAILMVGGLAFGGYELWQNMQKDEEIKTLQAKNMDLQAEKIETEEKVTEDAKSGKDRYNEFVNNFTKTRYPIGVNGYYYHRDGTDNVERIVYASIDKDGHLTITDNKDGTPSSREVFFEGDGYIGVHYIHIGNGGNPYFYLISEDGSVSRIYIGELEDREIEHLEEYSNIISIVNMGLTQALLIDIDGNTYLNNGL